VNIGGKMVIFCGALGLMSHGNPDVWEREKIDLHAIKRIPRQPWILPQPSPPPHAQSFRLAVLSYSEFLNFGGVPQGNEGIVGCFLRFLLGDERGRSFRLNPVATPPL
jgi:hypothetical protein